MLPNKTIGGEVIKQYLVRQGIDLSERNLYHRPKERVRRRLIRMKGGDISLPLPRSNAALREDITEKIRSGIYLLGEQIFPKQFTKFVLKTRPAEAIRPLRPWSGQNFTICGQSLIFSKFWSDQQLSGRGFPQVVGPVLDSFRHS